MNWLHYRSLTIMFEQVWNYVALCCDNYENFMKLKILFQFKFTLNSYLLFRTLASISLSMTKFIVFIKFLLGKQTLRSQ